ncbi:MAG: lipase family protein [Sneathiella sp.]
MLFVAVRGTEMSSFYDWQANISAKKTALPDHEDIKLHSGFYGETLVHAEKVAQTLVQISNENIPIYITGHSLGGAVAAVMNILFNEWIAKYPLHRPSPPYTFGMPRYGDTGAVRKLASPHAVFHPDDVVPKVPPEILGYADCDTKFSVASPEHATRNKSKIKVVLAVLMSSVTAKPVREHFIESYRQHIARKLQFDESKFLN